MHGSTFVADLAVVLGVAAATAVLARALRQPTVLGYLLAGLVVGPYLPFPVFADPERVGALAEFGVVLVMFAVGLELRIAKLLRVLPVSGLTALVGVAFLSWCGATIGRLLGWGAVESVFLGTSVAISSTMVVSRVFEEVSVARDVRDHVLGVLVVQDVLAIVLIAATTAIAAGGGLGAGELVATLGRLGGVLLAMTVGGMLVVPRVVRWVLRLRSREILAVVALGLCFGLAMLAEELGYSVALGAFVAGMLVAESGRGGRVEPLLQPLRDVFAAVFFVSIGMTVDPLAALEHLPVSLLVSAVVVGGQLAAVSVSGLLSGLGLRRSVSAGLALGQIGEFAFILAAIGIEARVVRADLQAIVVTVAVLTAFTTPLFLRSSARVVHAVDRRLPGRVQHLLLVHETWLERLRSGGDERARAPIRRAVRAIALDAAALFALLVAGVALLPELVRWVGETLAISPAGARAVVGIAAALLALPLLVALGRNTLALASSIRDGILERYGEAASGARRLAATTSTLLVVIGVLLAVGVPAIAVLRPWVAAPWGMVLLALAVVAASWQVWRSAGAMEAEYRSGAEQLADLVAGGAGPSGGGAGHEADLMPGLEVERAAPLREGGAAVGRTLAELDLRARTGATVVAILRGGERVVLPTGRERLEADDVLALVGSREAVELARAMLVVGREPVARA